MGFVFSVAVPGVVVVVSATGVVVLSVLLPPILRSRDLLAFFGRDKDLELVVVAAAPAGVPI